MNEELMLKVKVDTSSVTTTINKLKNEVSNINKTMNSSASSSSSTKTNAEAAANSTSKLTDKLTQMVTKIKELANIKNMGITDMVVGVLALNKGLEVTSKQLKKISNSPFIVSQGKMYSAVFEKLKTSGLSFDGATGFATGDDDLSKSFRQLQEDIIGADNIKSLEKLKGSMKELGVSTKGTGAGFSVLASSIAAAAGAAIACVAALTLLTAALITVAGVIASFKVSKLGDEIYHTAQRFGFSAQAYQEWSYIMERNGSTIDDLTGFLETLASEQAAVIEGSEDAIATFERLGLAAEEVAGMRQQELFEETVKRIQSIGDATERSAIAYSLFGDEASRLMNVLNMNNNQMGEVVNNYHLLGGAMSGELIAKSNALQNAIANMKQAWAGIGNTLAEVFIPVVKAVVEWLTKALVIVNLFLRTIFGLDLSTRDTAGSMNSATAATNSYAQSAKGAKKAVEELKRVTMGFDELNIVQDPNKGADSSSGSTGGGSVGAGLGSALDSSLLDTSNLNLEEIHAWFEEYKTVIQDVVTWSLIGIGVIGAILCGFSGNWIGVVACLGMAGLGVAVGSIEGGTFARLGEKIKQWWGSFKAWFKENIAPVFTSAFWKEKWNALVETTTEKLTETKAKIDEKWAIIKNWFNTNVKPVFTKQYWVDKWNTITTGARDKLEEVKNIIREKWNSVTNWFGEYVKPIFTKAYWQQKWSNIKEGARAELEEAKTIIRNIWNGMKEWFNTSVKPKFTIAYWTDKFNTIKDGAKSAFNGIIGVVEKAINSIITKINKLSWDIPDWVPGVGGEKFGFNFRQVSIPRLATGGIATGSTIANIGESGAEMILPLENNTQWMDILAGKIAERNGSPSKIVLQVGEKELGWATINSINQITKQTGGIQLAL